MNQSTSEITRYGEGVSVLICCRPTPMDAWLSFACWASIREALPDARVALSCSEREKYNHDFFRWTHRAKVPHFLHGGPHDRRIAQGIAFDRRLVDPPTITLSPHVMVLDCLGDEALALVRGGAGFDADEMALPAKDDILTGFCHVLDGVGSFVPARWIDRNGYPFGSVDHFSKGPLTANERRILQLWGKVGPLFDTIG